MVPTFWLANVSDAGESVAPGATPVPVRLAVCGLPPALSVTVRVPVLVPPTEGVNVTLMVQLALAASVDGLMGQLLVWAKSPLLVPVTAMLAMVTDVVPVLESVTVWAALVVPTCWLANVREVGDRLTVPFGKRILATKASKSPPP